MQDVGIKYDTGKVRPQLLFKSLNRAVMGVLAVLEYGAKKYAPDNWKKLDDIEERYFNAMQRHLLAIQGGEVLDPESGLPHIDHIICSALFISEYQKANNGVK